MKTPTLIVSLVVILAALALFLVPRGESATSFVAVDNFTERGISASGFAEPHIIPEAETVSCAVRGTWDGARVTLYTGIPGTDGEMWPVGVSSLDRAISNVPFTVMHGGAGLYRLFVDQPGINTNLTFHCRW